jgi:hypothetical protein
MSPFVRPDAVRVDEMLADAAVAVLQHRSVVGVNASALARWLGMSRQALNERLWDADGARRRVIRLTVFAFARRWTMWCQRALCADPPVPALPETDDEVHGLRVWAALTELARGDLVAGIADSAGIVHEARKEERAAVRRRLKEWLGVEPDADDVVEICVLTDGLRGALAAPLPDLTPDVARRVLVRRLHAIRATSSARSPA